MPRVVRGPANDNAAVTLPNFPSETVAVLDFETTGMSPAMGARATEIAVVLVQGGRIVDRYASLMHSGAWVPPFIEQLTGISNRMLATAPPAAQVMREVAAFTRGCALVAHNASFDRGFWLHEMALAAAAAAAANPADPAAAAADPAAAPAGPAPAFGCTLLLSRRLYPEAANHRLGTLARLHGITPTGRAHRALADAEMAAGLWLRIVRDVQDRYAASVPFGLLCALQRTPRLHLARQVARYFAAT